MSDQQTTQPPMSDEQLRAIESLQGRAILNVLGVVAEDYANKDKVAMALFGAIDELSDDQIADALDAMRDFGVIALGEKGRTAKKMDDYLEGYPYASAVVPRDNQEGRLGVQHFSKGISVAPFVRQMNKDDIRTVLILVEKFGWVQG